MKEEWIDVKDRLPKDVTPVLAYGECCDGCYNIDIAEIEGGDWWESGTGEDLWYKVTHWMPLPEPPQPLKE